METALITGASSGIGAAFAEALAARGMNLILVARSGDRLQDLARRLEQTAGVQAIAIAQDLTEPNAATKLAQTLDAQGLQVDWLINNAGFGDYGPFAERDRQRQLAMVQLNVLSLVDLTHQFLPAMRERRSGTIVNVSSIAGFQPLPYLSVYAATKSFVLSFSGALWAENKPYGVRVLALCPGPTETQFFDAAKFPDSFQAANSKLATVEEVVQAALKGLDDGVSNVVPGASNQFIVNVPRFLPRDFLLSAVEQRFKAPE